MSGAGWFILGYCALATCAIAPLVLDLIDDDAP